MPNMTVEVTKFIQEFISHSQNQKDKLVHVWSECLDSYLVRTPGDTRRANDPAYPYEDGKNSLGQTTELKDPETKQVIDTLLAKYMISLFGTKPYIAAKKRGREDATAAKTVTRLLDYAMGKEGNYRVIQTTMLDCLIFGTGIMELDWEYKERLQTVRDITVFGGQEFREETRIVLPVYDDIKLRNVDIMDFYPDPGHDAIQDMLGAAKGFKVSAFEALKRANRGQYDMEGVRAAIANVVASNNKSAISSNRNFRRERPEPSVSLNSFNILEGFEYWGEVPWAEEDGERWRVITILNGQVVRNRPWPLDDYRIPFYDFTLSPIQGRFWGLGAAEGIRYQQDFLDFLLMMIADSVTRSVHPPIIHNVEDEMDIQQLMNWSPDVPIASSKPNDIKTLGYSANLQGGFAFFNQIKNSIREGTGALGSVQGLGLGINRASATEAQATFQQALSRPELGARYFEEVSLPPLGQGILSRYKQELESSEELIDRIGELPEPALLADIQGSFDISFIGGRNYENLQRRIANIPTILQLGAIPQVANRLPWTEIATQVLEGAGFNVIAEEISSPANVVGNLEISRLAGGAGASPNNNNGQIPQFPDPETPEAQAKGSPSEVIN